MRARFSLMSISCQTPVGRSVVLALLFLPLCPAEDLSDAYRNALVAFKSNHFAEASQAVEKAITENPKEARPLLLRGRINTALKHYDEAEKDLRAALKLDHSSNLGYFYLGDLLYTQKKYDLARVQYATYHRQVPDDLDTTLKLVYCALGVSDIGEAQRLANTLNIFDEKNPAAYFAQSAIARFLEHTKPDASKDHNKPASEKYLQQAETLYGNILYNRYLPDYLLLFPNA